MRINNKKRAVKLKQLFFLVSVVLAIAALLFFLFDFIALALISIGVFSLWYIFFLVADYQFIEFSDENNKIRLRYYKAVSFGSPKFNEIEFLQQMLKNAFFDNSIFGKMSDLTLVVKTKRGIAEYPAVSLSAVKKSDRQNIANSINRLINQMR
jgi:hypothetical protein